jgi:hypothetical protein
MSLNNHFLDGDDELQRRVVNYLAGQHIPALRNLEVQAFNGAVTLRGRVRSFYEKQLSNHSASRVAGVRQVIDAIEVVWPTAEAQKPLVFSSPELSPARSLPRSASL